MGINSFSDTPLKRYTRKKRSSYIRIIPLVILIVCFITLSLCTGKLVLKMYQHSKLKSQYKIVLNEHRTLSENTSNLNKVHASKEQHYNELQLKYDELMSNSPIAYLTFDDGPSDNTIELLDTLDKYNVKATFFVVYKEGYDHVYKEIVKRGHVLANHTYSHQYKDIYSSPEAFVDNVLKLDKKLEEITGIPSSKILRFPGGSNTDFVSYENSLKIKGKLEELGYTFFDWNVDSNDALASTQPKEFIVTSVLSGTDLVNTANILMHDTNLKHTTIEALPQIIEGLKERGYRFKSLDHESVKIQF